MAELQPVQVSEIPQDVDAFVSMHTEIASAPQGGAAAMIVALLIYVDDAEVGQQCLAVAAHPSRLDEGAGGYKGFKLRNSDMRLIASQLGASPHIPKSYVKGTSPANGYQVPAAPLVFEFTDNVHSGDSAAGPYKVFVACSGADSPRPITVEKDEAGLWRAREWSTLVVGVKNPAG